MPWHEAGRAVIESIHIHPTAEISPFASIGRGTQIWKGAQVREGASIGEQCILGKGAYVDFDVTIGDRCKIQNNASIFNGATLEDGVFIGPHACVTNDRVPRAITPQGRLKSADDWEVGPTLLRYGCSIGAGAIVLPNVTIGRFALIGSGAVVTGAVSDHALLVGNPARIAGYVCACGGRLAFDGLSLTEVSACISGQRPPDHLEGLCMCCGRVTILF
jgi:UDP-2-acetamido-3-amino-2,3-dideoxy-glucuronate N-acetyltransferase